jgi:hypothetical protein
VEDGQREAKQLLEVLLERVQPCARCIRELHVDVVLTEGEDGHKVGAAYVEAEREWGRRASGALY